MIGEAEAFAATYNTAETFPVPIVAMIERRGVDILELPGLRRASGVAGQVANDLSQIQVDAAMYAANQDAYRHTVAHEVAHLVLHGNFIVSLGIGTKVAWKQHLATQDAALSDQVEREAAVFARYVLVPTEHLLEAWREAGEKLKIAGRDIEKLTDESLKVVAGNVARQFRVPASILERRLRDEKLIE